MDQHLWMLHGQNSVFHVLLVPFPQCSPRGSEISTDQISYDNWSQSWPTSIKLHGCILWSGPVIPMILLLDTMNYVPLAAILNLLKIDFFWFLLNSLKKFGQSIWAFLIIKLYGHYSASHVIWSFPLPHPPTPRGHTRSLKFGFHMVTDHKVDVSIWAFIYFIDKHHALLAAGYIAPLDGALVRWCTYTCCANVYGNPK